MPEDTKNLGAMSASTEYNFDLKDRTVFGRAAFFEVDTLDFTNNSQSTLSVVANGQTYSIAPGAPAHVNPGGRIESFSVTTNATAVNSGEVRVIPKGRIHPALGSA